MVNGLTVMALMLTLALQDVAKEGAEIKPSRAWVVEPTALKKTECLRITDAESWTGLWKAHAGNKELPPAVDCSKEMVLVLPLELQGDQGIRNRTLEVRETGELLRVLLKIKTTSLGAIRPNDPPPIRHVITIAVVPRSPKKVEFYFQNGKADAVEPKLLQVLP